MAMSFLACVPLEQALDWLARRQASIASYRTDLVRQLAGIASRGGVFAQLSGDHLLALADAGRGWVSRAIATLQAGAPAGTGH